MLTAFTLAVLSHLAPLTPDAFYVAAPDAVLVAAPAAVAQPCVEPDPRKIYPYWTVMPPFTGVPAGCWDAYEDAIAEALIRRLAAIHRCLELYATNNPDLCACVGFADQRFIDDCEGAEVAFYECCGWPT